MKLENNINEKGLCIEYSPDNKYLIFSTNYGNIYIKKESE